MRRLGHCELREEAGRGGIGVVYRAFDPKLDRIVAIKTTQLSQWATPQDARGLRERLQREARAAAKLSRPNIVAVFDFDELGDTAYIVMEFVEGAQKRARGCGAACAASGGCGHA